jgi:uncharacterized protein (UPF0332 family)
MLNNDLIPLINYLTRKAQRSLAAAKLLMDNDLNNDAISRLYYSVLYQTKALLLTVNVNVQKHSTAKVMLALHFTKTGHIDKNTFHIFRNLIEERTKADYDNFLDVADETTDEYYLKAIHFIHTTNPIVTQAIENTDQSEQ